MRHSLEVTLPTPERAIRSGVSGEALGINYLRQQSHIALNLLLPKPFYWVNSF
jgi:hypothetical protein